MDREVGGLESQWHVTAVLNNLWVRGHSEFCHPVPRVPGQTRRTRMHRSSAVHRSSGCPVRSGYAILQRSQAAL